MNCFRSEVEKFLNEASIPFVYNKLDGMDCFCCDHCGVLICLVEISLFNDLKPENIIKRLKNLRENSTLPKNIFLYEDKWRSQGPLVRGRLLAQLGKEKSIFARNCSVREITPEAAAKFLEKNHLYGATKARYRYGLFRKRATGANELGMEHSDSLVAVATFSSGRKNEDGIMSYEWERYASTIGFRIVGGMGKLLNHFVEERMEEIDQIEIMSYSDSEWSDGDVYNKLGFSAHSYREPVGFIVDNSTYKRIHFNKIGRDRAFPKELLDDPNKFTLIYNIGSIKFISRYK